MKTKLLSVVANLVIGTSFIALSATCVMGYMGVAGPMAKNMASGLVTVADAIASCRVDPSVENCEVQQERVNNLALTFTGSTELPAWVEEIQTKTNTPDMTADDNYLDFMLNAVPESVRELFTEGKIVDVANGELDFIESED